MLGLAMLAGTPSNGAPVLCEEREKLAISAASSAEAPSSGAFRPRQFVPVEVLRVIDGDTVEVRAQIWLDQWIVTKVRLRDIDAPERKARCAAEQALAEAARLHLEGLARGGPTFLADLGRDKYGGRVLGRLVDAEGADLGRRMLADGHASAYAGRRRQARC